MQLSLLHFVHWYFFLWRRAPQQKLGRTAALRLIVQPCDEDDEKDVRYFIQGVPEELDDFQIAVLMN
jgi:hypothetical protein